MIYSILKDENPCKTRKKIESIIKKIKLPVKLNCSNYSFLYRNKIFSHRLSLFNINEFGVNGKGRTKENSIASSYGELMERLQNQYLFPIISDKYIFAPDEKIININELVLSEIAKYFDDNDLLIKLANISNRVQMNYYKYSERYSALTNVRINNNETILLPFYSLKQEKNVNLPVYIINKLQGSTGMCAGNTMEEALVEGLSEICERYVLRKVFSSDIKLPNIPKNIYEKYKDIKKMVDYYEKNGYKLYIKDASLGCKLPVVCIIFHNIKNDFYHISFGAHLSLPIAIERNLTEATQGFDISSKKRHFSYYNFLPKESYQSEKNKTKYITEIVRSGSSFIEKNEKILQLINSDSASYSFSSDVWVESSEQTNNKDLLNLLIKRIYPVAKNEIYIRDVSFLGFPSAYIYIPKMSIFSDYSIENLKKEINMLNWLDYACDKKDSKDLTLNSLIEALEYRKIFGIHVFDKQISALPNEYMIFLCSLTSKDYDRVIKYSQNLLSRNKTYKLFSKKGQMRLTIANEYAFLKKEGMEDNDTYLILKDKYHKDEISDFIEFKKILSVDYLKKIIVENEDKLMYKKILKLQSKYQKVGRNLGMLYSKNMPLQENLKKLFNEIVT